MDFITIDRETCTKCGLCSAACPAGLIISTRNGYPRPISAVEQYCVRCGHCTAVCPSGSLTHAEVSVQETVGADLKINPEQCEHLIKSRRSVRSYQDRPVPRETISKLIDIARYAPTGHNNQEVEWLVIDDRALLRSMEEIGVQWFRVINETQPRLAEMFNIENMLKRHEKDPTTFVRDAPVLIVAHAPKSGMELIDCTIALGYFDLSANSFGLGCCWAGFVYFMATSYPPMQALMALPEGHAAGGCMILGYPAFKYRAIPARKAPSITWRGPS